MTPVMFKKNFEQIILKIQSNTSAGMLLITSVPVNSPYENSVAESFYNMIIECGVEYNIPVARVHEYWKKKISSGISHSSLVQGDGVHPMENGYRLMAEAVMELL
jgi:lysophospholipase L1-like esterase